MFQKFIQFFPDIFYVSTFSVIIEGGRNVRTQTIRRFFNLLSTSVLFHDRDVTDPIPVYL